MTRKIILTLLLITLFISRGLPQEKTYAEKLGFPKGARVLILHVDDAGMSWDSNQGVIQAIEKGVANSFSIMMPCPWVPAIAHYVKKNPKVDAGLHLTLTSEWTDYRWSPLTGKANSPGLVDGEGAFWGSVEDVVKHATGDEVEVEIRAQIERARNLGFEPTHLDSHMGTLFATPEFMKRYVKVGMENKIPVMLPGGHMTLISAQLPGQLKQQVQAVGELVWSSGLPVLDDLHNVSYDFQYTKEMSDADLQKAATKQYKETIKSLKPGLTMVIMHCTAPSEVFPFVTNSTQLRKADLLAMLDPEFKKFLQDEKIILTTWRELKERREKVK